MQEIDYTPFRDYPHFDSVCQGMKQTLQAYFSNPSEAMVKEIQQLWNETHSHQITVEQAKVAIAENVDHIM